MNPARPISPIPKRKMVPDSGTGLAAFASSSGFEIVTGIVEVILEMPKTSNTDKTI